ncbi:5-methyltetrahydropteroyltriglutamate--homocysteine S-methyltransferase [Singulisphaera acidiphila]|uniref:5-methyltetrahydropteroyltriglutamate--homocysteine methyltransferase n=1 Tax=Singulisphaera acidiphila (strain ATCC BAA-1392 / DSM 18658 / VKM B-2454 / MOB10) TaxID=886293 RepID=L0D7C7_SINAD|nr:5-methyltetrahydropteroyltriglutamate--homocysteine S-methyltransferase [Singulisphaera acidiphila]AGA25304.1 5-methyltetrahydropteroyltriglutamate--homocysteine S-methyltransferase [Singulisphaera acidiphila DSM 18658]
MTAATNLGFPRMGGQRELKKALERFWSNRSDAGDLEVVARQLRADHWKLQQVAGIAHVPSNDFSLYDQVLDTAVMAGIFPERFTHLPAGFERYFAMARGVAHEGERTGAPALEMTKWFDTNYHYLVPEIGSGQEFTLGSTKPVDEFVEAKGLGIITRPVLIGPVSLLLLAKAKGENFDPIDLWPRLLPVYEEILRRLAAAGAAWVQIDEPCLVTDVAERALLALGPIFERLAGAAGSMDILLATYFGGLAKTLPAVLRLPVKAVHLDLVRSPDSLQEALALVRPDQMLSLGLVDGRNIWKGDLTHALSLAEAAAERLGADRLMIAPSCSLLHVPFDLEGETGLDPELRNWLAFARQKLDEVTLIAQGVASGRTAIAAALAENEAALRSRRDSPRTRSLEVRRRLAAVTPEELARAHPYPVRKAAQRESTPLPILPTTTIGSFPQTDEVRKARALFRSGKLRADEYDAFLKARVVEAIRWQEEVGLDVLVHGEFERNDMVEYFGENLEGFAFTANGWVQSYGSRCVKPPIIFGDVTRRGPMTVDWARFAQALTLRPVKGMLTGPVTILQWSFVRDDQPRRETCRQIALAIRDEVVDLEQAGIRVIQIDEPALREGLPLRRADWAEYLRWAVDAFRLASAGVRDETQIHTHMCYCEFNDIIDSIAALDADVISIETSRSQMELLGAFADFRYPNEVGPGVYDIHSPRVPSPQQIERLLDGALAVLSPEQLWVNPDCGLKTRRWEEVKPALVALVAAAQAVRQRLEGVAEPAPVIT